jgi:multiple sugar transport system ATP-binding protein
VAEVVLKKVGKSFGEVKVIRDVDLDIAHGEFVVFVGPSGCGKSTLLRLIAGLEDITSGELFIDKAQVNNALPSQRGIAMVFQSYALYPHMTVYENLAFGLKLAKADKQEIDKRVREAARILQIDHLLERKPKALSGGQRQRVAIARAILADPRVLILDDATSSVDPTKEHEIRAALAEVMRGRTTIVIAHRPATIALADRVVLLDEGRIVAEGTHESLLESSPRYREVLAQAALEDQGERVDEVRAER